MDRPVAVVVVPDPELRAFTDEALRARQLEVRHAVAPPARRHGRREDPVELLIVDLDAFGGSVGTSDGAEDPDAGPVIVGLASSDAATPGEDGALFDVVEKARARERMDRVVARAVDQIALRRRVRRLTEEIGFRDGYHGVVGPSAAMERIREEVHRLASRALPVWLDGEAGTGKKSLARMLHALSGARGAFVVAPCEGLDEQGWRQRWFGGAGESLVEQARGGSLYLDELPEAPSSLHDWLLEQLERWPDGGSQLDDVRVIVGSRLAAVRATAEGRLPDVLARQLGSASIHVPALRERRDDVGPLARHFVRVIGEINRLEPVRISPAALTTLERYGWPGNVQELRNAIEHAAILARAGEIEADDLPDRVRQGPDGALPPSEAGLGADRTFREAKREVIEAFESVYLRDLMLRHDGNVTVAAQHAGMLRSALQRLLRKHRMRSSEFRSSSRAPRRAARPAESEDRG